MPRGRKAPAMRTGSAALPGFIETSQIWPRELCSNLSLLEIKCKAIPLDEFGGNAPTKPNFCLAGHSETSSYD